VEFSNPLFKDIYDDLVAHYLQNDTFDAKNYLNSLQPEFAEVVTDIFMDDEKHQLHGWLDKKQVFVKDKNNVETLQRLVSETIIAYREYLINKLTTDLIGNFSSQSELDLAELMNSINEYNF